MTKLLIYGASEFGHVIKPLALRCGFQVHGFIDDWRTGGEIVGNGTDLPTHFPPDKFEIIIGIGYRHLTARWELFERLQRDGYNLPNLIHPNATVDASVAIAKGVLIMAGAIIDVRARINSLVVIWPGAIINHDSTIGHNTFLSPGAVVCGHTMISENCFIGAGAVITDHVKVDSATFIKAGALFSTNKLLQK